MNLNLKWYKGKYSYSDGDVENKIIEFIKKHPNNYEESFNEDNSWPVIYHLSETRKNVISWYNFKKDSEVLELGAGMGALTSTLCDKCKHVTSVELSKRRATAILERNKDRDNLEIIVGNFNDIVLEKKYDYIILIGVFEYAALYMNSSNPYTDFLTKLKNLLKKDGHIIIAIENRLGLKYWCGSNEDHTSIKFDGLKNYENFSGVRTFSKPELINLFETINMNYKFYYMFPDYKFTQVIYTDNSINKNIFCPYGPYYYTKSRLILNESKMFKDIYDNKIIDTFANSFLVDLSQSEVNYEIEFAKFNNYRSNKFATYTYLKNDRFYKDATHSEAYSHIDNIYNVYEKIGKCSNIIEVKKENRKIYSETINLNSIKDVLDHFMKEKKYDKVLETYINLYDFLKKHSGNVADGQNIFEKYNIQIDNQKFIYYEHGLIDFIPQNIFYSNNDLYLIDQEWYEDNCPLEYVMYRCIINYFIYYENNSNIVNMLYETFNINNYIPLFETLEKRIFKKVISESSKHFDVYYKNYELISNLNKILTEYDDFKSRSEKLLREKTNLELKLKEMETISQTQQDKIKAQQDELNKIYNSRGYKVLNFYYKLKIKFLKGKNKQWETAT